MSTPATLAVSDLRTRFGGSSAGATVVDGVTFTLQPGRTTALVGELGCGKSVTALSLMRLIEPPGHIVSGSVTLDGRDLRALDEREMEQVRGARIGMVFQDPLTSLNPALSIGGQIVETLQAHQPMSRAQAERKAIELVARVGVANPEQRIHDYPHHFSGGMRQRVLIAAAISCSPSVIIADEPTTALDVTVQAKILRLLHDLQRDMGAALLLITHDLGVVAAMADEVLVMYAGRIVERADVDTHLPQSSPSLHKGSAGLRRRNRRRPSHAARADRRQRAGPAESTARLSLCATLPIRPGHLPAAGPDAPLCLL